jgi:hypothetical protein
MFVFLCTFLSSFIVAARIICLSPAFHTRLFSYLTLSLYLQEGELRIYPTTRFEVCCCARLIRITGVSHLYCVSSPRAWLMLLG